MAFMSGSPVLTDEKFDEQTREARGGGAGTTARQPGYGGGPGGGGGPLAGYATMTIGGTITANAVLMILLVGSAAYGWSLVTPAQPVVNELTGVITYPMPSFPVWMWGVLLGAFALGMVTSFVPKAARITAPLYCLGYGLFLGALSSIYNLYYNGIVTQAVFATIGIFTAMLILYATRIIKVTNKFVMIVVGATFGIFLMYMFAMIASLFGAKVSFLNDGSPLAILISVGIIIVAALNLAIDFAFIEKASAAGAPKYMEWYAAFGITVTLIWIYLEVLRLLAMLNRN
jgi:uncharacterized YccA/Bax inhibitor family protein